MAEGDGDNSLFHVNLVVGNEETGEIANVRAQLAELDAEVVAGLRKIVAEDYKKLVQLICELTLEIGDITPDAADSKRAKEIKLLRGQYSDMAEIFLLKIGGNKILPNIEGYISFVDWIKNNALSPRHIFPSDIASPHIDVIARHYFMDSEYDFGLALYWAYELVYHGVPIYKFVTDTGEYQMLPVNDSDYIFMFRLGKDWIDVRTGMFPKWIKNYYFKQSDLEAHRIFFRGELPDETGVNALRCAYRRYLSPNSDSAEVGAQETIHSTSYDRLMRAIAAFSTQYPDYRAHPPKIDNNVRPWLQSNGFATNEAEKRVFGVIIAEHFKLSS